MNIFKSKKEVNKKFASSSRRTTAAAIDVWIVLFLRIFVMQLLGSLWLNHAIMEFMAEFSEKFGTETFKNNPEHIDFIVHNRIFFYILLSYFIVIMVGALYHAYLNSSAWQGTIGKRLTKIIIVNGVENKITFKRALLHYFLSVLPFAYILYLATFQISNNLSFYQAVTASELNIFFGVVFIFWVQIHLFTKNKTTAYDMICNTTFLNGKTTAKWPWNK